MEKPEIWVLIQNNKQNKPVQLFFENLSTLDNISNILPRGAYTTLRTFGKTRVLGFNEHIKRLKKAASLLGISISIDEIRIRNALREILQRSSVSEARIRITLDLERDLGTTFFAVEQLKIPPIEEYQNGVKAETIRLIRTNPKAKVTDFIQKAQEVRSTLKPDIREAIMIDAQGAYLEGLSSNFFCIVDGVIWTAEEGVLPGTTRTLVLEEIQKALLPVTLEGYHHDKIYQLSEAFITSVSRSVLPVIKLDNHTIGNGKPGLITQQIMELYANRVASEIEKI